MAERLPGGQIQPVAQPVNLFVRPMERAIRGAAQPAGIPRVGSIEVINQGNGGNVQGVNNLEALAAALVPFNAKLREVVGTGLMAQAQGQYQKGQNEAARAAVLVNQQRMASMREYNSETRKVEGQDPIAAMAMDQVNPYRLAGRQNALARVAASEVGASLLNEYRNTPGLEQLDPSDGQIAQVKARATTSLLERYGLDDRSAGFLDYVVPAINEGWQRVTAQQYEDRQKFLKATIPATAIAEVSGIYSNALEKGEITVYRADGMPAVLRPEDGAAWENGLQTLMQTALDRIIDESGLRGEASPAREAVVKQLQAAGLMARDKTLLRLVGNLEVGPPGKDGTRPKASATYFGDLLDQTIKVGNYQWEQQRRQWELDKREEEQTEEAFNSEAAVAIAAAGGDPEKRGEAMRMLADKASELGIPADKALKTIGELMGTTDTIQGLITDPGPVEQFLMEAEASLFGPAWNARAVMQRAEEMMVGLPEKEKTRLRGDVAALIRRKEKDAAAVPSGLVNPIIEQKIKANLRTLYAGSVTEEALRKGNVEQFMAWNNANVAESARRQYLAYQQHVRNRVAEAEARKGEKLTDAEVLQVAGLAVAEYGKNSPEALQYLFPGVGKEPSVGGAAPQPGQAGGAKPPAAGGGSGQAKPQAAPVLKNRVSSVENLDNVPVETLKQFRSMTILTPQETHRQIMNLANGGSPPAALRRAAREAGVSPGEFLIRQADTQRKAIKVPDEIRKQLLRDGRQARGMGDYIKGVASAVIPGGGLVARGQNWLAGILSNAIAPPAMAADQRAMMLRFGPGRRGGGGGGTGRWAQGPATYTRGTADTGDGFTIPGKLDSKGRPVVFEREAANAFAAMVRDSGGIVSGRDVTSSKRSRGKNAAVGGVEGSLHLDGKAVDIHGRSLEWIRKNGHRYGWHVHDYPGSHGGHVEFRGGGTLATRSSRPSTGSLTVRGGTSAEASWYGGGGGQDGVAGGPTANGERFNPNGMTTAVQWSLRSKLLNKWLLVTNESTGKTIRVWANDVGPLLGDEKRTGARHLDLSRGAFRALFGSTQAGTGRIRYRIDPNQRRR